MVAHAFVNPMLLRWARERASASVEETAKGAGVVPSRLEAWERGEARPTFHQAQKLAKVLHAPFGFFFLPEPPVETLPLPDLRTLPGAMPERPSLNLQDTVRSVLQRQAWYLEYLELQGASPLSFVARFKTASPVEEVARDIRAVLGVAAEEAQHLQWDAYYRRLIEGAEAAGILVMRSGIVDNHTRRTLDVAEFRGFAVSDRHAPVVFINSADAPTARLFTLMHELAHLWIGSSGISNVTPGPVRQDEVFCNAVAGEFLAPQELFLSRWAAGPEDIQRRVAALATSFHVSKMVVWRRALDLGLIDAATYRREYLAELNAFREKDKAGGDFYRNARAKNSKRFAQAVIAEAFSGRLLLRDAGHLLGVQPSRINTLAAGLR
jgi:Zn-dependent peptidase ImmA (M78 family)/DNA-binding XRE family transcriptional regulator